MMNKEKEVLINNENKTDDIQEIKIKKNNDQKKKFTRSEVIILVIMTFIISFFIGNATSKKNPTIINTYTNDVHLNEFIKNYQYIKNNYYENINSEDLINKAISGMMESLDDPYSMYIDESSSDNFNITLEGSYKGIGVQILKDAETEYMLISSVFKNSPAFNAGLKGGDLVVSVNDVETKTLTASEFSDIVRDGKENILNLIIIRNNEEMKITVNKEVVVLDSVSTKTYTVANKKVGYIYIGIFANNTYSQFKQKLEELEKENIDALIIDVRSNTGGHLTSVDRILDLFLNKNQIMYRFQKNNKVTDIYGKGNETKDYKIVLLGDGASASASEVLIAGLRENLNSIFIGKKTYGKGTVQELVTMSDGTQYKITVKKWLTPKGNWVNDKEGIIPDIEQELSNEYYETGLDEDDAQLQKALEYLKEEFEK